MNWTTYFYLFLFGCTSCEYYVPFYGNQNILDYVELMCSTMYHYSSTNWIQMFLIEDFIWPRVNHNRSLFAEQLLLTNCQWKHLININIIQLKHLMLDLHKYSRMWCVFDFTNNPIDRSTYHQLLITLQNVYLDCIQCKPFILAFSKPIETLKLWSEKPLQILDRYFWCTVISVEKSLETTKVLHINPVRNGCVQDKMIFLPQNNEDYEQIAQGHCDLNRTTLTIAVNEV